MGEATEKMIQNAQNVSVVLERLDGELKNQSLLWKYFHLRPTSKGVTIVSHHPLAPMRGIKRTASTLKDTLLGLDEHLSALADDADGEKVYHVLDHFKFKRRGNPNKLEENIQAAFIFGMISHGPEYEGIQFLASELIILDKNASKQNRFDVVGYKDHILYIFELKRGYDTEIYQQINRYRTHFESHCQEFKRLLAAYPRTACLEAVEKIEAVKYIAVMDEARLSSCDWTEKTKTAGADLWLFRPGLTFHKFKV